MTGDELARVRRALQGGGWARADRGEATATMEAELGRREAMVDGAEPAAGVLARRPAEQGIRDLVVDRVEELCRGCELLLRRPLRGDERPGVLGWAQLERAGEPVPGTESLSLAGYLLARPTPHGTPPS